ncbi:serine hydrolase domain-containing protein [Kordiimonas pumila]|uniref:Serine hydrolase domain-containing protein n=1 Tax=Kordiimonas pumila TaxID=2161677 RepID=A0ABV7D5Y1_9PROT|nr:serine hydrolase domain-containing protein [Kordiimonas pumila]
MTFINKWPLASRWFSAVLILLSYTAQADESSLPSATEVDAAVNAIMAEEGNIGAVLAVMKNGEPVMVRSYGYADLENRVPVKRETVFQSGSVGKMFTATAVMMLKNEGKLSLDDKLLKYFPEGPEYWGRVTIRQMLQHRSGMARLYGAATEESIDLTKDYSDEALAKVIGGLPMEFEPGARFQYSNAAYVLLGAVIKKASGQFYGDYLQEKLFTPIGMTRALVNEPFEIIPNRATGYEGEKDHLLKAGYVSQTLSQTADGSLLFTIDDLIKWDQALRQPSFLSAADLKEMFIAAPYADGSQSMIPYGYGWFNRDVRGHRLVHHSGYWQGFKTQLSRYVDDGFTVAVLTNSLYGEPARIANVVAGLFNPDYAPYEPIADSDSKQTAKMKSLTFEYLKGNADKSMFAKEAKALLTDAQIKRTAAQLEQLENMLSVKMADKEFVLVHQRREGKNTVYVYGIITDPEDTQRIITVHYTINPQGKVTRLIFQMG